MWEASFFLPLARVVVRGAALLAPRHRREDMVREWDGELEEEARHSGGWSMLRSAFGALADAGELRAQRRRERETQGRWTMGGWMSGWGADLSVAARTLRRSPGFTVVAVVTLALGIGGSTAVFTLLDRAVLKPLPYPGAERLVRLDNQVPGVGPNEVWALSTAQFVYFSDHAKDLEAVGLYRGMGGNVMTPSGPERVRAVRVTQSMMGLLGARALLGRLITPDDDTPSAPMVALISEGFWRRVMGADPSVVGTTLTLNDNPVEIIGVMDAGTQLPDRSAASAPDLWMPLTVDRAGSFSNNHVYPGIGRLSPGVTPQQAQAELARLTPELPKAFPQAYGPTFFDRYGFRTEVKPLKDDVLGDLALDLWIVFGGVALVLLIAAANVANLFLVRMEGRRRELGIRSALGADRPAIGRYVLAEGMALSLSGGVLALLVAYWGVPWLTALAPDDLPRVHGAHIGAASVAFTLGLSVLVGLALTLYPLIAHTGAGATRGLSDGSRGSSAGRGRQRLRSSLVIAQVALALTLTVGAGLLVETMRGLRHTDVGADPHGVLVADLYLSPQRYSDDVSVWSFHRDVLNHIRAVPGVTAAGMGEEIPVAGGYGCTVQGFDDDAVYARIKDAGLTTCAGQERVTPGYFEALGIPVLEGRDLTEADNDDPTRAAVVVSKAFADRFWPGEDPIGKGVGPGGQTKPPFYHVVGVAGDVARLSDPGRPPLSQKAIAVYYPVRRNPDDTWNRYWWAGQMTLVVKSGMDDPTSLFPAIRKAVSEVDPEVPLAGLTDMQSVVGRATATISFVSLLLGIAAGVAMLLSAVGLYGVISYVVTRRTREIGMRMAIGAQPGMVQRMVVGSSLVLVIAGLALGVGLARLGAGLMRGMLVGVAPTDPATYVVAAGALVTVALVASWIPAWRASRVDPVEALRVD